MYCWKCGKELKDDAKFCAYCGEKTKLLEQKASEVPRLGALLQKPQVSVGAVGRMMEKQLDDNQYKIAITIISLIMVLACILPYMKIYNNSVSLLFFDGTQLGDGILYVVIAALCAALTWMGKRLPEIFISLGAPVMCIFEIYKYKKEAGGFYEYIDKGLGFYLIIVSSIALPIACGLYYARKRRIL